MEFGGRGPPSWLDSHSLTFYLTALSSAPSITTDYHRARQRLIKLFERHAVSTTPPDAMLQDPINFLKSWAQWQSQAFADSDARAHLHEEAGRIVLDLASRSAGLRDQHSLFSTISESSEAAEEVGGVSISTYSTSALLNSTSPTSEDARTDGTVVNALVSVRYDEQNISPSSTHSWKEQQPHGEHHCDPSMSTSTPVNSSLLPGISQLLPRQIDTTCNPAPAIAPGHHEDTHGRHHAPPACPDSLERHSNSTPPAKVSTRLDIQPQSVQKHSAESRPPTSMQPTLTQLSVTRGRIMLPDPADPSRRRSNPSFEHHPADGFLQASNRQVIYTSLLCALQQQPGGLSAESPSSVFVNCLNAECDRPFHICRKWWAHILSGGPPCPDGNVHADQTFNSTTVGRKGSEKPRMAIHGIRPNCNKLLFGGGVYDRKKGPMHCDDSKCQFGHDQLSHRRQLALVGVKVGRDFRKELGNPKGKLLRLLP